MQVHVCKFITLIDHQMLEQALYDQQRPDQALDSRETSVFRSFAKWMQLLSADSKGYAHTYTKLATSTTSRVGS